MFILSFFFMWGSPVQAELEQIRPLFAELQSQADQPIGSLILQVAQAFLDKPYQEKTLEVEGPESLVLHFEGFDCFTLVENCLAIGLLLKQQPQDLAEFPNVLRSLRYRQGKVQGYASRLHYTSDWAAQQQASGYLKDVTQKLGGIPFDKTINFMSTHRQAYAGLADGSAFAAVLGVEEQLNRGQRSYIPKNKLAEISDQLKAGDIIAITTGIKGLDVVHVGLAIFKKGQLHLLHASSDGKKVMISPNSLADYLADKRSQSGIMVFRPQEPAVSLK